MVEHLHLSGQMLRNGEGLGFIRNTLEILTHLSLSLVNGTIIPTWTRGGHYGIY